MDRKQITEIYKKYHRIEFLTADPLVVVHQYKGHPDQEVIAWLAAMLALGAVPQIQKSLTKIIAAFHSRGHLLSEEFRATSKVLPDFKHRFYGTGDIAGLLYLYSSLKKEFGSMGQFVGLIHKNCGDSQLTIQNTLENLVDHLQDRISGAPKIVQVGAYFSHMMTKPSSGSVCKRWLMFFKWMVRDDGIDLGTWKDSGIQRSQLLIPLDVHLGRVVRDFGLISDRTLNWKSVLKATAALQKLDFEDPTRFDFSLCRFGMFENRGGVKNVAIQ